MEPKTTLRGHLEVAMLDSCVLCMKMIVLEKVMVCLLRVCLSECLYIRSRGTFQADFTDIVGASRNTV
jgi:hypothetical protein